MRRLFFYGGCTDHFIATAVPFVQAAGGARAQVALLLPSGEPGCDDELLTGPALGLLPGCIIECHFSEQGGFPRLVAAMEQEPGQTFSLID